ncbi:hypothetical protein ES708_13513 [subsurface metagenome]
MKITVLAFFDRISLFNSMNPFLFSIHRKMFSFTRNPQYCLTHDTNTILFMDRWFLKPDYVDIELLKKLRDKYQTIFFFNGNAGGGIIRPEVLPYVDMFFNKSLFKDKTLYKKTLYGDELFTEHYHVNHGINDPEPRIRKTVTDMSLMRRWHADARSSLPASLPFRRSWVMRLLCLTIRAIPGRRQRRCGRLLWTAILETHL